ncbi:MAG: ATP-binding protein [Candidatus Tenebribacter mawsonii]|nr:ATP-binding protein [Candidatus Tenebribacter mawsonii]
MKYYPRILEKKIRDTLTRKEAIFILGARQVGKTTLIKHLMEELEIDRTLYFDLENPANLSIINKGINEFLAFLSSQELAKDTINYIFIDEIQYADDFSSLIKYFVDHHSDKYKFILSGSSSLQIRKKFHESLVGRKIVFELYPLTFSEFCAFKDETVLSKKLLEINPYKLEENPLRFENEKVKNLLKEFLLYGGFPKIVLEKKKNNKIRDLEDIVNSYIMKDIRHIFNLEKTEQFNHLIKLLAVFMGKELNITQLSNETKLHKQTLENYLTALESGYITRMIKPYHSNLATELRKTPKCYFIDSGIRNFLVSNFSEMEFRPDRGELMENFVFSQLIKKADSLTKINFWRTKNKQEIDFILQKENELIALEVNWNDGSVQSLKKFKQIYPEAEPFLVSMLQDFSVEKRVLVGYLV